MGEQVAEEKMLCLLTCQAFKAANRLPAELHPIERICRFCLTYVHRHLRWHQWCLELQLPQAAVHARPVAVTGRFRLQPPPSVGGAPPARFPLLPKRTARTPLKQCPPPATTA